jgi:hypothetical protein
MIRVKARSARGFWREGVHHPAHWVEHAEGAFGAEALTRLQAEPMLEVEVAVQEGPAPTPASPARPAPRARRR